jgi:hypothetical protein
MSVPGQPRTTRGAKFNVGRYVRDQIASGVPKQIISHALWQKMDETDDLGTLKALSRAAQAVAGILVDRNLKGRELERAGQQDRAIVLYEANIVDRFDGSHPYDRLRVIYGRRRQYEDVIRVCRAYIEHGQQDAKLKAEFSRVILETQRKIGPTEQP